MKRKILSWALCLCMALTWIPASALAADEGDTPPVTSAKAAPVSEYNTKEA